MGARRGQYRTLESAVQCVRTLLCEGSGAVELKRDRSGWLISPTSLAATMLRAVVSKRFLTTPTTCSRCLSTSAPLRAVGQLSASQSNRNLPLPPFSPLILTFRVVQQEPRR